MEQSLALEEKISPSIAGDSVRVQADGQQQQRGGREAAAQQPRLLQHSAEAVLSLRGHSGGHCPNAEVGARPGLHEVKGVQAQAAENAQTAGRILKTVLVTRLMSHDIC